MNKKFLSQPYLIVKLLKYKMLIPHSFEDTSFFEDIKWPFLKLPNQRKILGVKVLIIVMMHLRIEMDLGQKDK